MNIGIAIVTYNRKELLEESIQSFLNLNYDKSMHNVKILIVDNCSTDGTHEYIQSFIDNSIVFYKKTDKNIGGAGGFNFAIKELKKLNCDYVWLNDDDTIATENSLQELINADSKLNGNYGFLSSSVVWKDGNPCLMNRQKISPDWYNYSNYLKYGIIKTYYSTFVSFWIKMDVVIDVGLPIKEFFIWGDDVEYSNRISKKYDCFVASKSIVVHKTNNNVGSNIAIDDVNRISRYKYAYRNECVVARENGIRGMIRQFFKVNCHIGRVIFKGKKKKLYKIWIIISSSVRGMFFFPKIEYLK